MKEKFLNYFDTPAHMYDFTVFTDSYKTLSSNFLFRSLSEFDDYNKGLVSRNPNYSENKVQTVYAQISNVPTNLISCTKSFAVPFLYANAETPFRIALIKKDNLNLIPHSEVLNCLDDSTLKNHIFRQRKNAIKSKEVCAIDTIPAENITLVFSLDDIKPIPENEKLNIIVEYFKNALNIKKPFFDEKQIDWAKPVLSTFYKKLRENTGKYNKKLETPYENVSRYEAIVALMSPAFLKLAENPNDSKSLQVIQIFSECFAPELDMSLKENKALMKKSDNSFKISNFNEQDDFLTFGDNALNNKPNFSQKHEQHTLSSSPVHKSKMHL
jgi:hypothetical protein